MRHAAFLAVAPTLLAISVAHAAPKPCVEPAAVTATFTGTTSLRDLVTWVAGFTCKPVVYPIGLERTAGRIVIVAPAASLTPAQALTLFVEAARASGVIVAIKPDAISLKLDPNAAPAKCAPVASAPITKDDGEIDRDALQVLVDSDIRLDDPTHARISRTLIETLVNNIDAFTSSVRIVPSSLHGVANGFKLYAIRPSSPAAKLGFANGDTLTKINGIDLTMRSHEIDALRTADHFDVEIIRRGKPLTIEIDVVDSM